MRIIILAAGKGERLKPLTNAKPKCMVELKKKPIIQYQLDLFKKFNIKDINIITGYMHDKINFKGTKKFYNKNYSTTNMVSTLFCADNLFDGNDDILISYGDIVYNESVLKKINDSNDKINVVVDLNWRDYWQARMASPLNDAETLKIGKDGQIIEIGKKPNSYNDIEAQYIGLIKINKDSVINVKNFYDNLDRQAIYDSKDFQNMYMTSFLQLIADHLLPLSPVYIKNGWIEVDEPSDLNHSIFLKSKE